MHFRSDIPKIDVEIYFLLNYLQSVEVALSNTWKQTSIAHYVMFKYINQNPYLVYDQTRLSRMSFINWFHGSIKVSTMLNHPVLVFLNWCNFTDELRRRREFQKKNPDAKLSNSDECFEASCASFINPEEELCVTLTYYGSLGKPR